MNRRIKKKRRNRIKGSYKNFRLLKKISKRIYKDSKQSRYDFATFPYDNDKIIIPNKYITIDLEISNIEN